MNQQYVAALQYHTTRRLAALLLLLGLLLYFVGQKPNLQNILRQSYDYLTTMPKLRSTYDGRLIDETAYNKWKPIHR